MTLPPPCGARTDRTARRLEAVDRDEALALLAGVPLGRIVFTQGALPAVRPVNHIVDRGLVVVRTHDDSALAGVVGVVGTAGPPTVVAYEADRIDPDTRLGWSVVVTGFAAPVTDAAELARYRTLLRPWVDGASDTAVRITPDLVSAYRLDE